MKFTEIDTSTGGGSDFMQLEPGDNKVRIVSEAEMKLTHYDPEEKRSFTVDSMEDLFNEQKPKKKYLMYVIDRADGDIKLLEVGVSVVKQIKEFAKSEDYSFEVLPEYDITIKKTGQKMETRYSVMPARENTELTEEEQAKIADLTPIDEVCERLSKPKEEEPDVEVPGDDKSEEEPF